MSKSTFLIELSFSSTSYLETICTQCKKIQQLIHISLILSAHNMFVMTWFETPNNEQN